MWEAVTPAGGEGAALDSSSDCRRHGRGAVLMDPGPDRSERAFQGPRAQGPELTLTSSVIIMAS